MTRTRRPSPNWLVAFLAVGVATAGIAHAKKAPDPCKTSCTTEKQGCQAAYKSAFDDSKTECTGTGKVKRQCVAQAKKVYKAAVKQCRGFFTACKSCCKSAGSTCDVKCGDGVVATGEDCDPPGRKSCPGDVACDASCHCPAPSTTVTTSTVPGETTSTTVPGATTSTTVPGATTTTVPGATTSTSLPGGTTSTSIPGATTTTVPARRLPAREHELPERRPAVLCGVPQGQR